MNLLSILLLLNMLDYLTTIYACSNYYCIELNDWILRYPVIKFFLPLLFPILVYRLETAGVVKPNTTKAVIAILAVATGIAALHNLLLIFQSR